VIDLQHSLFSVAFSEDFMWRMWQLFDPRQALVGLGAFLFTLAIIIHFILLSTDRYNWLEGPRTSASQQSALPSR
jgi:light-harvesting complex 1 alpha chain